MYKIGDKIVYPSYGAGVISAVEEKLIQGIKIKYYVLDIPGSTMKVMIPTDKCVQLGVRDVISVYEAQELLRRFRDESIEDDSSWNKRYRDSISVIRTGDIFAIAKVLKGLMYREKLKGLSTSERRLFNSVRQMVLSELELSGIADRKNLEDIMEDIVAGYDGNTK